MSNVPQPTNKSQSKFKYQLPQDALRVKAEATICALFTFFHDCIASRRLSKLEIEVHAIVEYKKIQDTICTNDLDLFTQLFVQYYTETYLEKQEYYKQHPQELEAIIQEIETSGSMHFLHNVLAPAIEADFQKKRGLL